MKKRNDGSILIEAGDDFQKIINNANIGDVFFLEKGINLVDVVEIKIPISIKIEKESIGTLRLEALKNSTKAICKKCAKNKPITKICDSLYYHDNHFCPASGIHNLIDKEFRKHG